MDLLPILIPLEKALNSVIQSNDAFKDQLKQLAGKSLGVNIKELEAKIFIVFSSDKVYFQQALLTSATTEITATPFALLRLMLAEKITPKQFEDITLRGDAMFAQQVKKFFVALRIDWQYYLTPVLGDVVVETTDQFIEKAKNGLRNLFKQFNSSAVSYLQNEINYLPHPNAMDQYVKEVSGFRDGVERLQARLNLLQKAKVGK